MHHDDKAEKRKLVSAKFKNQNTMMKKKTEIELKVDELQI